MTSSLGKPVTPGLLNVCRCVLISSSNAGYCFIDFQSAEAAAKALTLNGTIIPNSNRPFKLNWASGGGLADRRYAFSTVFAIDFANVLAATSVAQSTQFLLAISGRKSMNTSWFLSSKIASHHANPPRS